jgi:predicted outer membrane repeat protein
MRCLCLLGVAVLATALGSNARAGGTVTLCASDEQVGPGSLDAALAGGGKVTFACGTATIRITRSHEIGASTAIDGANNVTLDAQGRPLRMFWLLRNPSIVLELTRIKLRGAGAAPVARLSPCAGGSIISAWSPSAEVRMTNVTVSGSVDAISLCGDTRFTIAASTFAGDRGTTLSISNQSSGRIEQTSFVGNQRAVQIGGSRPVVFYKTSFRDSSEYGLSLPVPADVEVRHCEFIGNGGPNGAAIRLSGRAGTLLVRSTVFSDNHSTGVGGAIAIVPFAAAAPLSPQAIAGLAPTRLRMVDATFKGNSATSGGAVSADLRDGGSVEIVRALFADNTAQSNGGAIAIENGGALLAGSILERNRAREGAAIYTQAPPQRATTVANTLVADNAAQLGGGALSGAPLVLENSTVARNAATGLRALGDMRGGIRLSNTIIAENRPGNCAGAPDDFAVTAASLVFPNQTGCPSMIEADPILDDLYAPMLGSPAIAASEDQSCFASPIDGRDLYLQARPLIGKCSLGAVEYFPERAVAQALRRQVAAERARHPEVSSGPGQRRAPGGP